MMEKINYTMLFDFYEVAMSNAYYKSSMASKITYFDMFYRSVPDSGGFAIFAGLEQALDYVEDMRFDRKDIEFLAGKKLFSLDFLNYLETFRFTGDIFAVPEGTPIFPQEPFLIIKAPAIEAQMMETFLLLTLNHQSLIATKANRIVRAAEGRIVAEFGSRRAHGANAALAGARAAFIGGCSGTACTMAEMLYGVPASGTMAHSWVQMFDSEYEAFAAYCREYPRSAVLLVDTYNVLKSGVPNAIRAFQEVLEPLGCRPAGIRLDSGDITYLSKAARAMLDEAGFADCKIIASNSLDEHLIRELLLQGACIDSFGVGERLITAKSDPVFGGVYKLAAVEDDQGQIIPKIKVSENVTKITTPHFKKLYRLFQKDSGQALADLLCVYDETIDESQPLELFDPDFVWKRKNVVGFTAKELLIPVFLGGKRVYQPPALADVQAFCRDQVKTLWAEVTRFENPHNYYVDLSPKLWGIKQELLMKMRQ